MSAELEREFGVLLIVELSTEYDTLEVFGFSKSRLYSRSFSMAIMESSKKLYKSPVGLEVAAG